MWSIFWQTIKDKKVSLIIYCLSGVILLLMYTALFPSIQEQADKLAKLVETYPPEMMKAFGIEELVFDTLESYLAMEQFSFVWPIMMLFLVISLAGNALAGDIGRGTIELWLARPISRLKLYLGRYLAGLGSFSLFTLVSIFSVFPIAELLNIDYRIFNYFKLALVGFLFGWALFSIAFMLSAMFSDKGKVYGITAGLIVVMYVIKIVATLKESLQDLKYFSFFHYYNQSQLLIHNNIESLAIIVFTAVIVVCTILGAIWFKKRDIAV